MISQRILLGFVLAAMASVVGTYGVFKLEHHKHWLTYFVYADVFFILFFLVILIVKIVEIWGRHRGHSTHLYRQNILLYSCVAVIPSLFVFMVNYLFLNQEMDAWFARPVKTSLRVAQDVSRAYMDVNLDHLKNAVYHAQLRIQDALFTTDAEKRAYLEEHRDRFLHDALLVESQQAGFSEALIVNQDFEVVEKTDLTFAMQLDITSMRPILHTKDITTFTHDNRLRVTAPIGLVGKDFLFLVVGKILDPKIIQDIQHIDHATSNLMQLETQKNDLRLTVTFIMSLLTALIVVATVWFGFSLSDRMMRPISDLILTAQQVKAGQWNVRAQEDTYSQELSLLIRTFNMMLEHIYAQHADLEYQKNMTEAIIHNIATGIIVCNQDGTIKRMNESSNHILCKPFSVLPEDFRAMLKTQGVHNLTLPTPKGFRTLKVSSAKIDAETFVLAFEDVTELLMAQKQSSWRDIARRVAHEIKNPLTPIQLAAERLRKRYAHQIQETDREIFNDCIDIIIRQVQSIFRLVRDFTSFAQMKAPQWASINLAELCRKMTTFFQESNPDIQFDFRCQHAETIVTCDEQQIQQVFLNLLNNSVAVLREQEISNKNITITLQDEGDQIALMVHDNGQGFPEDILHQLTEPYVTRRKNGTGLGLSVVAKIIEDHGGRMMFENRSGALTTIVLRKYHAA